MPQPTDSLGSLIGFFNQLKADKRRLEEQATEVGKRMDEVEQAIIEQMDAAGGLAKAGPEGQTVKIVEVVHPQITNFDELVPYIYENKYIHLLERRVSVTGARELFERGVRIPGVQPYVRRRLRKG